jgi:outer membrane protein assembly factor BamD (BamD/ComL family)
MKKIQTHLLFAGLMVIILMTACKSPRDKSIDGIAATEQEVFSENGMIDRNRVDELIDAYVGFADEFPEDALAPDYLFKAGDISMNTNRSRQAIRYYDRIINDYPDYKKTPEAMFLKGYVYENNLGRLDKAKEIYEAFLQLYPDNEFADDAEVSLRFLGKSPEELIEIFQQEAGEAKEE